MFKPALTCARALAHAMTGAAAANGGNGALMDRERATVKMLLLRDGVALPKRSPRYGSAGRWQSVPVSSSAQGT